MADHGARVRAGCGGVFLCLSLLAGLPATALCRPVVAITSPADQSAVAGETWVQAAFRSDSSRPVTRLELSLDGRSVSEYVLPTPLMEGRKSFAVNFTGQAAGAHKLTVRALDAAGEAGQADLGVSVQGGAGPAPETNLAPPTVTVFSLAPGTVVRGRVQIRAEASSPGGIRSTIFLVDGRIHTILMSKPPYAATWDTTGYADGPHTLEARARDTAGNEAASAPVTVVVQNHAPALPPGPAPGAPGGGTPVVAVPGGTTPRVEITPTVPIVTPPGPGSVVLPPAGVGAGNPGTAPPPGRTGPGPAVGPTVVAPGDHGTPLIPPAPRPVVVTPPEVAAAPGGPPTPAPPEAALVKPATTPPGPVKSGAGVVAMVPPATIRPPLPVTPPVLPEAESASAPGTLPTPEVPAGVLRRVPLTVQAPAPVAWLVATPEGKLPPEKPVATPPGPGPEPGAGQPSRPVTPPAAVGTTPPKTGGPTLPAAPPAVKPAAVTPAVKQPAPPKHRASLAHESPRKEQPEAPPAIPPSEEPAEKPETSPAPPASPPAEKPAPKPEAMPSAASPGLPAQPAPLPPALTATNEASVTPGSVKTQEAGLIRVEVPLYYGNPAVAVPEARLSEPGTATAAGPPPVENPVGKQPEGGKYVEGGGGTAVPVEKPVENPALPGGPAAGAVAGPTPPAEAPETPPSADPPAPPEPPATPPAASGRPRAGLAHEKPAESGEGPVLPAIPPPAAPPARSVGGTPTDQPHPLTAADAPLLPTSQMLLGGKPLPDAAMPEVQDGVVVISLKHIFEAANGAMYWFSAEKRARAVSANADLAVQIGSTHAVLNGEGREMAAPATIKSGRVMVPLDVVAEALGAVFEFDPLARQVTVRMKARPAGP